VSQLAAGAPALLRYFTNGRPTGAFPTRRISDAAAPVLWLAAGTSVKRPAVGGRLVREAPIDEQLTGSRHTLDGVWRDNGILVLGRPGRAHAIWLFWEGERFLGWYVNLEAPWRRSRFGYDSEDHLLDIWVDAGGSWRWKDEDELARAVHVGFFSQRQAAAILGEGERVVEEWPFPTGWEDWRPDPEWQPPPLPAGWDA
jgi:hypothetical protein